jgi:ABC-2 type transport system permease protein
VLPSGVPRANWPTVCIAFLGESMFFGIYLPMAFRFGYSKVQAVGALIMFAFPFLVGQLKASIIPGISRLRFLNVLSATQLGLASLALGVLICVISGMVSTRIFEQKDL